MSDTIPPQNQPVNITQVNGQPVSDTNPLPVSATVVPAPPPTLSQVPVSVSAAGDNTLVAGVVGKVTTIYRLALTFTGATTATFKDGSTALTGPLTLFAGGSITLDYETVPWFTLGPGDNFVLNLSLASSVSGIVYYTQA